MLKCAFGSDGVCKLLNKPVVDKCHCPYYTTNEINCDLCGQPILSGGIYDNGKIYCAKCGPQLGHCATCRHRTICTFETDPSPVPKMIQQTVRQGNMMSSFPVKNPNRIEITCKKGCGCWNEEFGCLREFMACDKWEI